MANLNAARTKRRVTSVAVRRAPAYPGPMQSGDDKQFEERMMAWIERRWRTVFWLMFLGACVYFLSYKWGQIRWLALSDTDDNMRLAQVHAWLAGQPWFDLRQHKLAPPDGLNIHWSRIVDLPIAGLILIFRPFVGAFTADRIACAVAPMLALAPALWAIILTSRRAIHPRAYPIAFAVLMCASTCLFMWMPLRTDHHGWQLAMLALVVAGLADPNGRRGGATAGLATAVSFGIGLELLPLMALAGTSIALRWAWDAGETGRMRAYAVTLAGGCAIAFGGFASYDNRAMVCDVLSPVWLSTLLLSAALLMGVSYAPGGRRPLRCALVVAAGAVVAGFFLLSFPQCLGRPEGISPELERLWFANIREVKPLYTKPWRDALQTGWLPVIGALGAILAALRARGSAQAPAWIAIAALSLVATLGMFWQSRFGPQAQLMGVFGATALGWWLLPKLLDSTSSLARIGGTLAVFFALSGQLASFVAMIPKAAAERREDKAEAQARGAKTRPSRCSTIPGLAQLDPLPAATMLTFIDFGPRLIAMTKHSAIAGPYHRNGQAILDVQKSFRAASPEVAHEVMRRRGATMLLLCPGMAESTIYRARAPQGFYMQLMRGEVPGWLQPVALPDGSPFLLWKMVG
ncbi:AcrB/AcrD/AcrF family protein [Sphingomonadaceae bacterium G21617-S1]|nr:AcrB/AcrD/AcrF family protein [Sphingomonadaceae bacterium G21617-S1]